MRKLFLLLTILSLTIISCEQKPLYPRYTLEEIVVIPDSLKVAHRQWITETVRAASQNMTGGDYEDVDETIQQVEITGKNIFGVKVIGLKKEINADYWDDLHLTPTELSKKEKFILDSLLTK